MPLSLPNAVLWDMDGTLIDQTAPIIQCYREVITGMGYPDPPADEIRRSLGGTMASTMALFTKEEQMDEACSAFRKRFPDIMFDGLVVLPGALALMKFFESKKIPQAIFTNKHGETAREISKYCGFSTYISVCIGNTDTAWSKPDPELTRFVLGQIKARPENALLIGDSPTDAESANNAGIRFLGVCTGAHNIEELEAAGAELACPSLEELHRALAQ